LEALGPSREQHSGYQVVIGVLWKSQVRFAPCEYSERRNLRENEDIWKRKKLLAESVSVPGQLNFFEIAKSKKWRTWSKSPVIQHTFDGRICIESRVKLNPVAFGLVQKQLFSFENLC
jgi:hypothetical protein